MTEPSQYFKGRTIQEQMDEVIGYVDKRAEEVAAAKADDVLQPAEEAKTAAQSAAQQAEAAKDTTLAALPEIRQDISGLKAEDAALDGRLDTVELKVTTAEGNIVTIQGKITEIENKNTQQDSAIAALQTADGKNVKINNINQYAVGLTGNQNKTGVLGFFTPPKNASLYEKIKTDGDWIIGKIPAPTQTIVINAISASRNFNGIQLWVISVLTDGRITVSDQLGGTPPTIKHMVKDDKHYLAVTTIGNDVHYSIKWIMCRKGGTLSYMETTDLPVLADSSYVDVNA